MRRRRRHDVTAVTVGDRREEELPVYERLGILPEIADGLGRSSNLTVPPQR